MKSRKEPGALRLCFKVGPKRQWSWRTKRDKKKKNKQRSEFVENLRLGMAELIW